MFASSHFPHICCGQTRSIPSETTPGKLTQSRPPRDGHSLDTGGCWTVKVWNACQPRGRGAQVCCRLARTVRSAKIPWFPRGHKLLFKMSVNLQQMNSTWQRHAQLSTKISLSQNKGIDHSAEHNKYVQTKCPKECSEEVYIKTSS